MTTTYCVRADVAVILSEHGIVAMSDDNQDGLEGMTESEFITRAIEMGANRMNSRLGKTRYSLADLVGNTWARDCNAVLASVVHARRRGNIVPPSLQDAAQECMETIEMIQLGQATIPDQSPSFDTSPTVSSFKVALGADVSPVRVIRDESTGDDPPDGILRRTTTG